MNRSTARWKQQERRREIGDFGKMLGHCRCLEH